MSTHKWWWNNLCLCAPCCKLNFHKNCYHASVGLNVLSDDDHGDEMSQAGLFELVSALQYSILGEQDKLKLLKYIDLYTMLNFMGAVCKIIYLH